MAFVPHSVYISNNFFGYLIPLSMVTSHSLHIARSTLQIPLEGLGNIQHFDDVFHTERFLLVDREGLSGAYCVLDLFVAR